MVFLYIMTIIFSIFLVSDTISLIKSYLITYRLKKIYKKTKLDSPDILMYLLIIMISFVISYISINYKLDDHHIFVYIGSVSIIFSILGIYYLINYIIIYDLGIKYKGNFYYYDKLIKKEVSPYYDTYSDTYFDNNTKKITFTYESNELSIIVDNDTENIIDGFLNSFNKK